MEEVKIWEEEVVIPTYEIGEPDKTTTQTAYANICGIVQIPNPKKIFEMTMTKTAIEKPKPIPSSSVTIIKMSVTG